MVAGDIVEVIDKNENGKLCENHFQETSYVVFAFESMNDNTCSPVTVTI